MHTFSFVIVNVCLYCNGLEMLSPDSCFHMFLQLTTFHIAFVGLVIVRCFFLAGFLVSTCLPQLIFTLQMFCGTCYCSLL